MIAATSKLFARYRALQVPVFRIKTDRAKEFVSKRFREWTAAQDLDHCYAAGDEPTGNTRAEIEVGVPHKRCCGRLGAPFVIGPQR